MPDGAILLVVLVPVLIPRGVAGIVFCLLDIRVTQSPNCAGCLAAAAATVVDGLPVLSWGLWFMSFKAMPGVCCFLEDPRNTHKMQGGITLSHMHHSCSTDTVATCGHYQNRHCEKYIVTHAWM